MIAPPLTADPLSPAYLNIGSLVFEITNRDTPITLEFDQSYWNFLSPGEQKSMHTVVVRILTKKKLPSLASLMKIFDTSLSLAIYSDSHDKYIVFHPPGTNEPQWIARIDENLHNVDIYCNDMDVLMDRDGSEIVNPMCYPLDQLLLINLLVGRGLLIHAAGMIIDNKGYLFAGPSGAGKSTICNLFKDADMFTLLSDDRIVVQRSGNEFLIYGTPWPGDAKIAMNDNAPLHGIFFLNKRNEDSIKELNGPKTLDYLFKVASLPLYDDAGIKKSLDFIDNLLKHVKTYELNFKPGPEIVKEVISFVTG